MASALALAHIEGERRLRVAAKLGLTRIWQSLPGLDRANLDQWLSEALPLVESAQRASATLTQSYLARAIERPPVGIDPTEVIGAAARNGTPPEEVYARPFVTVWSELAAGKLWADASAIGLDRATSAAAMDVQLAMRGTLGAVQRNPKSGVEAFERVADGDACEFCSEVDGAKVNSADAYPLHNGCGCSVEPMSEPVEATPPPDTVAVHEHGEFGPVLAAPDHSFLSQAEAEARQ